VAGVDVGGTFTDFVQLHQASGQVRLAKAPSTPNAVLERKLSRTGVITTAAFRDVLELGRPRA
jgi:N-methylhydantoinase A